MQPLGCEAVLTQPVGERNAVERGHRRVVGTRFERNGERASSACVPPVDPVVNLPLKLGKLPLLLVTGTDIKIQPFIPATLEKDTFLGFATKELLLDDDLALSVAALSERHLIKQ